MQQSTVEQFRSTGYVVIRNLCPPGEVAELKLLAIKELNERSEPIELEADIGYPGAPTTRAEPGGGTIRRLLNAVDRSPRFEAWMCGPAVGDCIEALIGEAAIMSRVHHNCIMTKHAKHGGHQARVLRVFRASCASWPFAVSWSSPRPPTSFALPIDETVTHGAHR